MKKIKKILKKLNNNGSSIIMVIVSLAFIGIIVGALMTAAGYTYKLKMQDLNARDNFYYVEQAMDEIYAGVGSETVKNMQEAYTYTIENMTQYDLDMESYKARESEEAEAMFKKRFLKNLSVNSFFDQATIATELQKFISNDSVKLDGSKLFVERVFKKDVNGVETTDLDKIILRNVTVTREANYKKSIANGNYRQTVSADIEIGEPDFSVMFNQVTADANNLFQFSMVADMGVEIDQNNPLTVAGNIYAASDFYNKKYDESNFDSSVDDDDKKFDNMYNGESISYKHGSVTNKTYESETVNTLHNNREYLATGLASYFDGLNEKSMYSGLYINDTTVSVLADMVIVPGTISVMNTGSLSVYGKNGKSAANAEIWTDNIVLGGYSTRNKTKSADEDPTFNGASALLRADLYVKDDTELNATSSSLKLKGNYYGFSNSTKKDNRSFVPTVDLSNFKIDEGASGDTFIRDHYNSSAIIVNGQKSKLDFSQTGELFLAGRSYIELSKKITEKDLDVEVSGEEDVDKTVDGSDVQKVKTRTFEYLPTSDDLDPTSGDDDTVFLRDYKTGESISSKANQLAYIPVMFTGMPTAVMNGAKFEGYWLAKLHPAIVDVGFFKDFFPSSIFPDGVPCIMQEVSGKKYYYYDFHQALLTIYARAGANDADALAISNKYPNIDYTNYARDFIEAYVNALEDIKLYEDNPTAEVSKFSNPANINLKDYLVDIGNYEDFDPGEIIIPQYELNNAKIYSSGAITTKSGTKFDIVTADGKNGYDHSDDMLNDLLSSGKYVNTTSSSAFDYSDDLSDEYARVKWNLNHFSDKELADKSYIDTLMLNDDTSAVKLHESDITPINKYLNFDEITSAVNITPSTMNLASGYDVWISYNDVVVSASDSKGIVKGIILTKGDVTFEDNVKSFEGLIVSGGKVYMYGAITNMASSPEICRAIIKECQLSSDENCQKLLKIIKGYENTVLEEIPESGAADDTEVKSIENIDYSDVVRFDNWKKNVE